MKKKPSDTPGLVGRTASYLKELFGHTVPAPSAQTQEHASWGRVAIVISHERNMWALGVVQRFVAALREQFGYQHCPEVEILSAQGSAKQLKEVMSRLEVRQQKHHSYELVVTVGNWCSKEVRDHLDGWHQPLPQVFCPVNNPVRFGLVDSLDHTGRAVSGVTAVMPDYEKVVEALCAVMPEMQSILVPYDPCLDDEMLAEEIEYHRKELFMACQNNDIAVRTVSICSPYELKTTIGGQLGGVDAVCTLPEPTIYACMETLVAACNEKKKLLCTAELSSVYQGAAIGFGQRGSAYGPYAAAIVYDMLVNHRPLSSIPVIRLSQEPLVRFNLDAMIAQGVQLSTQARHLLSMSSIFHDSL